MIKFNNISLSPAAAVPAVAATVPAAVPVTTTPAPAPAATKSRQDPYNLRASI